MSEALAPDERAVPVPGGSVHTSRWTPSGTTEMTPLILFHDSIGCIAMWREFPAALARRLNRPVIAYDRLGFGQSTARQDVLPLNFISAEAERYLPAILTGLGIQKFMAFGHSVGGAMAVLAAAHLSARCQAVITESAQAYVEPATIRSIADAKLKFQDPRELAKLARFHGTKARWVVDAWTDTWLRPGFRAWSLAAELPRVLCPLLAIHGNRDEYGSEAFPETLSTMVSGVSLKRILQNCGHVPHREQEAAVLDAVQEFLRQSVSAVAVDRC